MYWDVQSDYIKGKIQGLPWERHKYIDELITLARFIREGAHSFAGAMHYRWLKEKYTEEYLALLEEYSPERYREEVVKMAVETAQQRLDREDMARQEEEERRVLQQDWEKAAGWCNRAISQVAAATSGVASLPYYGIKEVFFLKGKDEANRSRGKAEKPHGDDARALQLTVILSRQYVPAGRETELALLLKLKAAEQQGVDRFPLNLSFVLDRSGSMAGMKLAYTKRAVEFAVRHLTAADAASVVSFNDEVETRAAQRKVTDKNVFYQAIQGLQAGGSTNLSGGLFVGYRNVREQLSQGQVNRVLLLTDGLANVGITDPEQLTQKVENLRKEGITLTTLGVGDDFDEELLTTLANAGGGESYYIDSAEKIPKVFKQELQGLLSVVAQGIVVGFRPIGGCRVTAMFGYSFSAGPDGIIAPIPDMYAGEERGILLELAIPPLEEGRRSLGSFSVEYEEVGANGGSVKLESELTVLATGDDALMAEKDNPEVSKAREIHRSAEVMEEAVRYADEGRLDEAVFCLNSQFNHLQNHPFAADSELSQVREEIRDQIELLRAQGYDKANRKQMVYNSNRLRQVRRSTGKK